MPIPEHLQANLAELPREPGCYLMHDGAGRVVYVGKAKVLRNRLLQYFNGHDDRAFVSKIDPLVRRIDWIITPTEKAALLLEATLIKRHRPRFNIMLKDMERSVLLRIDEHHEFPSVVVARRRSDDKARYFGPFDSAGQLRRVLGVLQRYFRLRTCSDEEFKRRQRVCMEYEIGRCSGPCVIKDARSEYGERVDEVIWFLRGRTKPLLRSMEARMQRAAEALQFERAARLRDDLAVIRSNLERQVVVQERREDLDVMVVMREADLAVGVVLPVRGGAVIGKHTSLWRGVELDDRALLRGFLLAFYDVEGGAAEVPPRIVLGGEADDREILVDWLSDRRGKRVRLAVGKQGVNLRLLDMARRNALDELQRTVAQLSERRRAAERLRSVLRLPNAPVTIDALDISTFQGRDTVGGRVRFVDGKKTTKGYRTVHVKGAAGGDDFGAMRQVIQRLYAKNPEDRPDLLLIDGGRAQLSAVMQAFAAAGIEAPPTCGLAKARELREGQGFDGDDVVPAQQRAGVLYSRERVFLPGRKNPLRLRDTDPGLAMLVRLRDEVHRFAITAHRKLRQKRHHASALDLIPGIGPAKRKALLRAFGSTKRIADAPPEVLCSVPGISPELAERIAEALKG